MTCFAWFHRRNKYTRRKRFSHQHRKNFEFSTGRAVHWYLPSDVLSSMSFEVLRLRPDLYFKVQTFQNFKIGLVFFFFFKTSYASILSAITAVKFKDTGYRPKLSEVPTTTCWREPLYKPSQWSSIWWKKRPREETHTCGARAHNMDT